MKNVCRMNTAVPRIAWRRGSIDAKLLRYHTNNGVSRKKSPKATATSQMNLLMS